MSDTPAASQSDAAADPSIEQRLTADMKAAMKAGEKDKLTVIRMILADVKVADMNGQTPEQATDTFARKARKAEAEYQKYNEPERAAASGREAQIAESYLPAKADAAGTAELVDAFLDGKDFGPGDVGRAMGAFMKLHAKDADPAAANARLREKLTNG